MTCNSGTKDPTNSNVQYADVYVDNSFPLSSSINPNVEQNNYVYYGCFHGYDIRIHTKHCSFCKFPDASGLLL